MLHLVDHDLPILITKIQRQLHTKMYRLLLPYNITPDQFAIITLLAHSSEGLTPTNLAQTLEKEKPTTIRLLEKVENKKLIYRLPSPNDKRSYLLFLTDEGHALVKLLDDIIVPKGKAIIKLALTGFDEKQVAELRQMLNAIQKNLK